MLIGVKEMANMYIGEGKIPCLEESCRCRHYRGGGDGTLCGSD